MVERNKKIAGHLELTEIKCVMKEYKASYDMYRKLLVISMVYQGETISKASAYVHTSRKTGERWVKNYNEKGLKDFIPIIINVVAKQNYPMNNWTN